MVYTCNICVSPLFVQIEIKISSKNCLETSSGFNSLLSYRLWEFEHVLWQSCTLLFPTRIQVTFSSLPESKQASALIKYPEVPKALCGLWVLNNSRKFASSGLQKQKIHRKLNLPTDLMSAEKRAQQIHWGSLPSKLSVLIHTLNIHSRMLWLSWKRIQKLQCERDQITLLCLHVLTMY